MKVTLRQARRLAELSQAVVADKLNITCVTLKKWEQGITHPTIDKVIELSKLYGVPIENFKFDVEE